MGLDAVEFVVALEKALELEIPDRDFGPLRTPRELVAYLCRRLPETDPAFGTVSGRWTQEDVEQVVEGLLAKHSSRRTFDLDTDLRDIFP